MFFCLDLDDNDPLKLYPGVERVEKKEVSDFSIIYTTEHMKYYSSKFCWFKENDILSNTTNIFRHSNFIRLDFSNLKEEETGVYKCNITDDKNLQKKPFQLMVFGRWLGSFDKISKMYSFGLRSYDILLFLGKSLAFFTQLLLIL